jgi:hypothetical protein
VQRAGTHENTQNLHNFADPQVSSLIITAKPTTSVYSFVKRQINITQHGSQRPPRRRTSYATVTPISSLPPMTMVDSRYYGGMGHDNMYSSHMQSSPHFSNPWTSHETHSTSAYPPLPKSDLTRPSAMSMTYPQMPVSVPLSSGSSYPSLGYGGSDLLSGAQDIPRATYDNPYTTPSTSTSYTATASAYPQLGYAQSLHQHQQHQQQQRKGSDQYVCSNSNASVSLLIIHFQK